ncbi:hypothetical protein niasHT_030634 [Heterodera trifolii]|uniref:Large ribosomal subunit protein uL10m n=1 Tax=Heterodera trifolii TaxID=157864 RepID=A0ABD2I5C4_9BILA
MVLLRLSFLSPSNTFVSSRRGVQCYYFFNLPRPYRRRLYETTLAPIMPKRLEEQWKRAKDPFNIYSVAADELVDPAEFTKYELALVEKLRGWITAEQFRVMAICQMNATKEETLWLAKNRFRLNGVELCAEPAKILRKLFEQSQLSAVTPLLVDECTCLLFGKDPEQCIHQMVNTSDAYAWIQPIAFVVDSRILPVDFISELSLKHSRIKMQGQMAQMFDRSLRQIPSTMDALVGQITRTLDAHLKLSNGQ